MIKYQKIDKIFQSSLISSAHGFGTKFTDFKVVSSGKFVIKPKQTHSINIKIINDSLADQTIENCDGLITKQKNVILSVITADCVPIIFNDAVEGIVGISHQGWKGTFNRLPSKMVDEMVNAGSSAKNIHCAFGPAINDCSYEIFGERLKQFQNEFKSESIFRKEKQKYFLNMYKANYQTLTEKGIPPINIDFFPFCTSCDSAKFYSYHRDKKIIGEMTSFVLLRSHAERM